MSFKLRPLLRVLVIVAVALAMSGCVYLRLLALKRQLADFEAHFALTSDDGVSLLCKEPVLRGDDLRWLGIEPETVDKSGASERWHVRWVKQPPDGLSEPVEYDVELFAEIRDEKVHSVQIPERYFQYFSKGLFLHLLRATAHARIDKGARSADVAPATGAEPGVAAPGIDGIERMLGAATQRADEGNLAYCMYRYLPQTKGTRAKPIEVTFVFEGSTGRMTQLIAKLSRGTVRFTIPR